MNAIHGILADFSAYVFDGALEGDHSIAGNLTVGGESLTFPIFTFTADAATDTFTATAHPLKTGAGPVQATNSGGALPGGLLAGVDYYAISTGANTFQLATTRARALSGMAINITSNGTGTQDLRPQAGTTLVHSTTINGTLDATQLSPLVNARYAASASQWAIQAGGGGQFEGPSSIEQLKFTADGRAVLGLRMPAGAVLKKIRFAYDLAAAGNSVTLQIGSRKTDLTQFSEENLVVDSTSTAYTTTDVTNFGIDTNGNFDQSDGPHVLGEDRWYWIAVSFARASGTIIFYGAIINPT